MDSRFLYDHNDGHRAPHDAISRSANDLLEALRESAGMDNEAVKKPKAANANSGKKATASKSTKCRAKPAATKAS